NPMLARVVYWRRAIGLALRLRPTRSRRAVRHRLQQRRRDAVITMMLKDMRHGARLFVKQPAFALAAIVTIGLAIGANTVIFTMANVLVFKPLPIREPDRLGWIFATGPDAISGRGPISLPEYTTYRGGVPGYASLSAYRRRAVAMNADGGAERVLAHIVIG